MRPLGRSISRHLTDLRPSVFFSMAVFSACAICRNSASSDFDTHSNSLDGQFVAAPEPVELADVFGGTTASQPDSTAPHANTPTNNVTCQNFFTVDSLS